MPVGIDLRIISLGTFYIRFNWDIMILFLITVKKFIILHWLILKVESRRGDELPKYGHPQGVRGADNRLTTEYLTENSYSKTDEYVQNHAGMLKEDQIFAYYTITEKLK